MCVALRERVSVAGSHGNGARYAFTARRLLLPRVRARGIAIVSFSFQLWHGVQGYFK